MAITKHAMTRYAERIAGRDELIDINIYIAQNEDKIIDDINKMCEHSELIYTGKVGNRDNNPVNVYLSGTWINRVKGHYPVQSRIVCWRRIQQAVYSKES